MRTAGFMSHRVTPLVRTTAKDSHGVASDTWTTGTTVWGALTLASDSTRFFGGGDTSPATHVLTVDHEAWCVAGNRVTVDGVTYDIAGSDGAGHLALAEAGQ